MTIVPSCTIAAATGAATRDGRPLLMSTSDDPFTTRTRLVVEAPTGGYRFIAAQIISPPPVVCWSNMHTRGLNEAGLAYTWSYVTPADEPTDATAIGIPYYQWGRLLLSEASGIDDALALMESYPRAYHGNYLLADAGGEICLVEVGTTTLNVAERTRSGVIGRANHWTGGVKQSVEGAALACSSQHRHRRVNELLSDIEGRIDAEALMAVCRDHAGRDRSDVRTSICAHHYPDDGPTWFGTVSSEISEPAARTLWYCFGWPCGEASSHPDRQPGQENSWGVYLPFPLAELPPGEYVTTDGRLTPLALRAIARGLVATGVPAIG